MSNLLKRILFEFPRDAENEGGAGAGGSGGDAAGGGGAGDAGGDGDAGAGGSGPDGGEGGPPSPYFPEGLPDTMRGDDERATMDNMAKALKGFRDRDASREVPKEAAGYLSLEGVDPEKFTLSDDVKPHFEALAKDPGAAAALKVFQEAGVDRGVVRSAIGGMFEALKDGGMLEPFLDTEAERQALLPDSAKGLSKQDQDQAIDRRMQENEDFVKLMTENGGLPPEAGEYAQLMLMDSAKGHAFFEWMRGKIQGGESDGPGGHGNGGAGDTRESLRADLAALEKKRGSPDFKQADYDALEARYKKQFAD